MVNPKAAIDAGLGYAEDQSWAEPTPQKEPESVIDPAPLEAIRAVQPPGDNNLLARIIGLYLDEAARLKGQIAQGIEQNDGSQVRAAAHSLKSSSANVGAMRVSNLSRELEDIGRSGNLEEADIVYAQLDGELEYALTELAGLVD